MRALQGSKETGHFQLTWDIGVWSCTENTGHYSLPVMLDFSSSCPLGVSKDALLAAELMDTMHPMSEACPSGLGFPVMVKSPRGARGRRAPGPGHSPEVPSASAAEAGPQIPVVASLGLGAS